MSRKKPSDVTVVKVPKNATQRQIYSAARKAFTASDLQKFTVIEPTVPADQVIAEMEQVHRDSLHRQRRRK